MRRVAIVSTAQTDLVPADATGDTAEMAFEVARRAVAASGLRRDQIDLTVSASSDVLEGRPFHFLQGIEALGVWPPTSVSHVEMDGAWAAYYAWIRILSGSTDAALVVAWSKTSEASMHHITNAQLDPFCLSPLGLDDVMSAALQADAYFASSSTSVEDMEEVVARSRAARTRISHAEPVEDEPDGPIATPLWRRHSPRWADGACAIVLAAEEIVRGGSRPAWIAGADHRSETGALGHRDLASLPSAANALSHALDIAGWSETPDFAELAAAYAHQELMLRDAFGLGDGVEVNPSGGALAAHPMMATGLIRLAEAADLVAGTSRRALAHAAAGHAMQQNMVFLLQGDAP